MSSIQKSPATTALLRPSLQNTIEFVSKGTEILQKKLNISSIIKDGGERKKFDKKLMMVVYFAYQQKRYGHVDKEEAWSSLFHWFFGRLTYDEFFGDLVTMPNELVTHGSSELRVTDMTLKLIEEVFPGHSGTTNPTGDNKRS